MAVEKAKIGKRNQIAHVPTVTSWASVGDVLLSWRNNQFNYPDSNEEGIIGFRSAQLGAFFAIKALWNVSSEPATIVIPRVEDLYAV